MKQAVLVMSGYNERAVVAFLRTCKKNNIPYYIIASSNDDQILKTNYKENVSYIRQTKDVKELLNIAISIKKKNNIKKLFFIPTTEYLNRYLLDNREIFFKNDIIIPLTNDKTYSIISDKFLFRQECKKHGIPITEEYIDFSSINYPCVLKPKSYSDYMGKPILIKNEKEFHEKNNEKFYVEEYINGNSHYLLFYFARDGKIYKYSQKNYIQQPNGKSMIMAKASNIHNKNIANKYINLFNDLSFHGLVMVEVKEKENDYVLIEANPRLWGPSQFTCDSNIHYFEYYLKDMGFKIDITDSQINEKAIYFWEDGIVNIDDCTYYSYSKEELIKEYESLKKYDIYNREDTHELYKGSELIQCKKMN